MAELSEEEFQAIYGPIRPLAPEQAGELFGGAPFRWWIAGGLSVDDGAVPRRRHDDLEVAIVRSEFGLVREWLRDYHLWDIHDGTLSFVTPEYVLPEEHEQLWLRRDAFSPWLIDLMLTPVDGDTWLYKRDRRISRPLDHVVRAGPGGLPYQRPEVTLLYKAKRLAPRDELDFEAVLPGLSAEDRSWLRDAIELSEPADHPWLERLSA